MNHSDLGERIMAGSQNEQLKYYCKYNPSGQEGEQASWPNFLSWKGRHSSREHWSLSVSWMWSGETLPTYWKSRNGRTPHKDFPRTGAPPSMQSENTKSRFMSSLFRMTIPNRPSLLKSANATELVHDHSKGNRSAASLKLPPPTPYTH